MMTPQGEPTDRPDEESSRPQEAEGSEDRPAGRSEMTPRAMMVAFAVPWIMILAIVGAAIGGVFLDRWLHTTPWLTLALIVLGVVGGGFQAYRSIMKVLRGK
jgi:F0F1-type ATP synthase assembly protein I